MKVKEKFMTTKKFNELSYGEIFREPISSNWFLYVGLNDGEWAGCIDVESGRGYDLDMFYDTHIKYWFDLGDTKVNVCDNAKLILK